MAVIGFFDNFFNGLWLGLWLVFGWFAGCICWDCGGCVKVVWMRGWLLCGCVTDRVIER